MCGHQMQHSTLLHLVDTKRIIAPTASASKPDCNTPQILKCVYTTLIVDFEKIGHEADSCR